MPDSYRRYLERFFREAFELQGTPLKMEFRKGVNPYGKRREQAPDAAVLWRYPREMQ